MEGILNFRDVGETLVELNKNKKTGSHPAVIKTGVLFRGAKPDDASDKDIKRLEELGICTILDLRSGYETTKSDLLVSTFPYVPLPELEDEDETDEGYKEKPCRKTVRINLSGRNFERFILSRASWLITFQVLGYFLICQKHKAAYTMGSKVVNLWGMSGMYTAFLDGCRNEIRASLELMTNPENLPIYVHCAHGKDRTGFVIAIALSLCGVDDESIIQEYALSQHELRTWRSKMVRDMEKVGLSEEFAMAYPEAMRGVLDDLRTRGGIENYLTEIGFPLERQKLVKQNLCGKS